MQVIELKPIIINQDEENETQVDCILKDTVEAEMLISRSDFVAVCVNSDRTEAEEKMFVAVSMESSELSSKSGDSCDAGVPLLTPTVTGRLRTMKTFTLALGWNNHKHKIV